MTTPIAFSPGATGSVKPQHTNKMEVNFYLILSLLFHPSSIPALTSDFSSLQQIKDRSRQTCDQCLKPLLIPKLAHKAAPILLHSSALHDLQHQLHGLLGGNRPFEIRLVFLETFEHGTVFRQLFGGCYVEKGRLDLFSKREEGGGREYTWYSLGRINHSRCDG